MPGQTQTPQQDWGLLIKFVIATAVLFGLTALADRLGGYHAASITFLVVYISALLWLRRR